MEGSSNALLSASAYLNASNTNVSNFVSVKLSGGRNYLLWKAQMLCLLKSIDVCGIVDDAFGVPIYTDPETMMRKYDNLVSGWIFGSVTEDVLADVYNLGSAKAVWEKLQSNYDPPVLLPEKTNRIQEDTNSIEIKVDEDAQNSDKKKKVTLRAATIKGDWSEVESILKEDAGLVTEAISSDGSTVLHIAVGIGHNDFVKRLFLYIDDEQILQRRVSDGSTALHIAAIVGNKDGAELLVKENKELLKIKDHKCEEPLKKAYENMHLDTIGYLLKAASDLGDPGDELAVQLLVNAISAKQYSLALEFVRMFPRSASKTDDVLMAMAKTFPTGLDYWEELVYPPSFHSIKKDAKDVAYGFISAIIFPCDILSKIEVREVKEYMYLPPFLLLILLLWLLLLVLCLIVYWVYVIFIPLQLLHNIWWYCAMILVPPIKLIENKMKEWDEAKKVLKMVCDEIDKLWYPHTHHPCYARPILEAARQNAYEVVDEILSRSHDVIESTDKNGYDIIQLAIINRSEKIYNLIYDIGERKNLYRTYKDSSENNILHLAGKLAPPSVLNKRTGAALQLQRELQWREEVKKFVFPSYITRENIFKETPEMVFTREHKDLVKEGEQWIKTAAESCSITAALIVTIVFAAAITIPGGSHEGDGTPLFKKRTAFLIFAISDAISLFASSTALLVFLSILTTRFAEKDFLVSLPRRLFIGLFFLLLSTTTMIVAYSATLFLVFSDEKQWMLAPICGLAFIPISFFVGLQFPLMVDLFSSTYIGIFGKKRRSIFNKDEIRLRFGNNLGAGKQGTQLRRVLTKTLTSSGQQLN